MLLTTNGIFLCILILVDKTIKLWKVFNKRLTEISEYNLPPRISQVPANYRGLDRFPHYVSSKNRFVDTTSMNGTSSTSSSSSTSSTTSSDSQDLKSPALEELVPEDHIKAYPTPDNLTNIRLPTLSAVQSVVTAQQKREYPNSHVYHINSISLNSDGETYLSADDLRINLWHLDVTDTSFSNHSYSLLLFRHC